MMHGPIDVKFAYFDIQLAMFLQYEISFKLEYEIYFEYIFIKIYWHCNIF